MFTGFTGTNASSEVMKEIGVSCQDLVASGPKATARQFREQNGLEASCSFQDIRELNDSGGGHCWRCLAARCSLPSAAPDLAVLGFPCRPYSSARMGSRNRDNVEHHPDFALTEHTLKFIFKTRPLAALCENVARFDCWVEDFCAQLALEGYHAQWRVLPLDIWVDAHGSRVYIFAVDGRRAPATAVETMVDIVDTLQAARQEEPPTAVRAFMLSPGTFLWGQHVEHLLVAPSTDSDAAQPAGNSEPCVCERQARFLRERWRRQGFEHHDTRAWTEVPYCPPALRGLPRSRRIMEVVELGYLWASQKRGRSPLSGQDRPLIAANLFVDVSQNPGRCPWSFGLHRLTRNSRIYSYEHDRILSPFEAFRVYGWRNPCLEGLAASEAWDLLGDSMALPTLAVAVSAVVLGAGPYMPGLWETG
ncbi:MAG: hypothetical protein GY772_22570 [bacterium]|nr:hypothetical protein [bacterium]